MKVSKKTIRSCRKLQEEAHFELSELSCRVTMLTAALERGSQDHPLWPGSLTALWDIQKSVDKAGRMLDRLGAELSHYRINGSP